MFCKQFSQVCTSNLIFAASSNCQQDSDSFLVLLDDVSRKTDSDSERNVACVQPVPPKAVHAELNEEVESATLGFEARTNKHGVGPETKAETNALYYVLGVLLRKLNNIHTCVVCSAILLFQSKHVVNDKQRYMAHKVYAGTDKFAVYIVLWKCLTIILFRASMFLRNSLL
jgi:hypothetical protein